MNPDGPDDKLDPDGLAVTPETPGRYSPREHVDDRGLPTPEIGRGGIGRVILALDGHLGREVAVKELLPGRAGAPEPDERGPGSGAPGLSTAVIRFLREARVTGQLEHPNIVPVYELGRRADGTLYYTMKIVRGRTLAEALAGCRSLADRLGLLTHFVDLCQAVAYAHSRGVVHRDLKPDNVMLGEFGETVVLDWGLAKVRGQEDPRGQELKREVALLQDASGSGSQTVAGTALGTPRYMSPEQAEGDLDSIDERSDVWSLGAVLFEILTGRPAFEGLSAFQVLRQVIGAQVPEPTEICPSAPAELAAICRKAMQRDRTGRYAGAGELAREVSAFLTGGKVQAHDYRLPELLGRFARKHKLPLAIVAVSAALLAALAVWNHLRVVDERNRALQAEAAAQDRLADSLREGARAAFVHQDLPEARARLRTALQLTDSRAGRGLWRQLTDSQLIWRVRLGALAYGLDFSPDGRHLAVAANDGQVYLVDPATATAEALPGTGPQFLAVAFSPDGRTLAGGVNGGPVHLWDLEAGTSRRLPDEHEGVKDLAFSPEGRWLATGSWEGSIRLWDLASGRQIARADIGTWVAGLAFAPDGRSLYAGCAGGGVKVLSGGNLDELPGLATPYTVGYIALRPDGLALAAASDADGRITVFDLASASEPRTIRTPASKIGGLAWAGGRLAFGDGHRVRVMDPDDGRVLATLEGHAGAVRALAFDRSARRLASAGTDVRLWRTESGQVARGHSRKPSALAFRPNSERLYTTGQDQTLRVWDTRSGRQLTALKMGADGGLAFHPTGAWLVTTHQAPRLLDPDSLAVLAEMPALAATSEVVVVDPDGSRIAIAVRDKVLVYDARTRKRVREATCAEDTAAVFLHGERLLCAAQKSAGEVLFKDLSPGANKTLSLRGHKGWVWFMAFDAGGTRLVTAGDDGTARVWALPGGRMLQQVRHAEPIRSALFHPTEELLATASNDRTVRVWDLATGRERLRWRLWSSPEVMAFDPTGRRLAVSSLTNVRLFDLEAGRAVWRGIGLLARPDKPPWIATNASFADGSFPSSEAWVKDLGLARLARRSESDDTLCNVHSSSHEAADRLVMWDSRTGERLSERRFAYIHEVIGLPGACALLEVNHPDKFGRALLVDRTGRTTELAVDATALAAHGDDLLVTAEGQVLQFDSTGALRARTPIARGLHLRKLPDPVAERKDVLGDEPTALTRIGGQLVLGDTRGRMEHLRAGTGEVAADRLVLRDSFPAGVELLIPGPPGTVAAGFADGHLGVWDLQTGVRLISAKLNGPVRHLALYGDKLYGLTALADSTVLDLGIFQRPWCDLLGEIWEQVPMEWTAGQAVRTEPPAEHPCMDATTTAQRSR